MAEATQIPQFLANPRIEEITIGWSLLTKYNHFHYFVITPLLINSDNSPGNLRHYGFRTQHQYNCSSNMARDKC